MTSGSYRATAVLSGAGTHPALTRYRSGTCGVDHAPERAHIRCVRISVLGPLTLDDSAPHLSPRETLVLAALAVAGDEPLSADQLSEVVWGDTPPASWHKNLQTCVVRLRKVLGPGAIKTTGHGYHLTLPVDAVDARRFEALAARGHELLETVPRTFWARRLPCGADARTPSSKSGSPAASRRPACSSSASTPRNGGSKPPSRPAATATSSRRPRHWPRPRH